MTSPRSLARAEASVRGVALSPRGSARDRVMEEMFRRERAAHFELVAGLSRAFAAILTGDETKTLPPLERFLRRYQSVVTHLEYVPEFQRARDAALKAAAAKAAAEAAERRKRDESLLGKVANFDKLG